MHFGWIWSQEIHESVKGLKVYLHENIKNSFNVEDLTRLAVTRSPAMTNSYFFFLNHLDTF